jgi:hypothetical protein
MATDGGRRLPAVWTRLATAFFTDGFVYESGDSRHEFTIQSISKPFVYGLALDDHGASQMFTKVGLVLRGSWAICGGASGGRCDGKVPQVAPACQIFPHLPARNRSIP